MLSKVAGQEAGSLAFILFYLAIASCHKLLLLEFLRHAS